MASQPPSNVVPSAHEVAPSTKNRGPRRQRPDYRQIHRFPLPLTVHPLPPLIPHNPISVISVLLSYLTYLVAPPHTDIYAAYFDSNTSSVHVTDEKTVRALWEMGFFGKGSLSRSEPTWLDQEKKRRGLLRGVTSEELTRQRRAERRELKLQRARSEKLIIEQRLQAEAAAREGRTSTDSPSDLSSSAPGVTNGTTVTAEKFSVKKAREARFLEAQKLARQDREANEKTVQFSTTNVDSGTLGTSGETAADGNNTLEETTVNNEEHLQLSNEEAFFLVYGLGALHIFGQDQKTILSANDLLALFCHHSYSPPRQPSADLKTDDPFLISYVVYHHFRSLGWVVRSGVKFGVDYMIYNRGPVFSHAEFAVVVIPSYDHPYWSQTADRKAECDAKQARSWWWFHCVNRVQAQVKKTLVACYVEIPPPSQDLEGASASSIDIGALLGRYSTQDDSIDIARLQRVALGLVSDYRSILGKDPCTNPLTPSPQESITSQPFLEESRAIEITPPQDPQDPHQPTTVTHPDATTAIPDTQIPSDGRPTHASEAEEKDGNVTKTLDLNRQSPERTTLPPSTVPPTAKMGSAETLPSDTQVISQSVYDEILRRNNEGGNDRPDSNAIDRATLMTLNEGDSGHIDLLSGFDGAHIHLPNTDENDDQSSSKLGESSPLMYERNVFPESQRFITKTPVTATKQHHVEAVATVSPLVSRNPLASDLESASGVMALSQVFKATQAPSSPLVNGLQSDLMSDRPSPNIPIQHRPVAPSLSSPFNTLAATFPRESSQTQMNYITLKESQARRDNMAKERMTRSADHIYSEDHSDGEFDKEPSFIERARRQRRIDQETAAQFAAFSAPARQLSHPASDIGRRTRSVSGAPERQAWSDGRATAGCEAQHEPAVELQNAGISEEETEQEEELPQPTPRSLVPNSSTEEDKENCNDPSAVSLSQAASAHDRLSQALSLHESPVATSREPAQPISDARLHRADQDVTEEPHDGIRSSPITVVKDSQRYGDEQAEHSESPSRGSQARVHASQQQQQQSKPEATHERTTFLPAKNFPLQHLTQGSEPHSEKFHTAPVAPLLLSKSDPASSAKSSHPSGNVSPSPQPNTVRFHDSADPEALDDGSRVPTLDSRDKSSSMPSRVAETPVRRRQRSSNDPQPVATIPETSPNRMAEGWMSDGNNEAAEDDDLPPPYPRAFKHTEQSQPAISDSSSPIKPLINSNILSSPSGRQRRALTEIAADASPQVGGALDVNINILSADDQEFRSALGMSPIPPRKRRRGNDGRNITASDPIVPVTPRSKPQLIPLQEVEEGKIAPVIQPTVPEARRQGTFPRRAKPSKRSGSIWDTEDSPKFRVSSKERSQMFARSLARERQPSEPREPREPERAEREPQQGLGPAPVEGSQMAVSTPAPEVSSSEPVVGESPAVREQHPPTGNVIIAPNQVIAIWRGQKRAYFPATCFGQPFRTSPDQYLIKFEDSAPLEVPIGTVKRLELQIGDAVKVDMPNVPKVAHIVKGFADKLSAEDLSSEATKGVIPVTDVYGHATVILGPKQRKSLPSCGLSVPESVINVPISRIYLDTVLWNRLQNRSFSYNSGSATYESRFQTPSDRHTTPTSPSTRLSRSFRLSTGLFSGMVFAVSYGDKSDAKYRVTKMILENDGRILEDGFNELFELPLNAPLATPTRSPAPISRSASGYLQLKSGVEDAGFACLIADKHSRRPKYMQALALNLPCLSDRWVEDCVAKGQILDWEMYLLPAGESSYLNGATKSRILTPYPASKARFSETVAARPNLLNGQSVLLITGRHGKADEERRRAYIFLTYALGASKIERVPDIKSAREALSQSQSSEEASTWDWIYIDDDDKAAKTLASGSTGIASKKRRKSRLTDSINEDDLGLNSNVRIVGNEFVCQSLILGRLVD
ncbi:hypothetical protein BJY04DRAFT_229381 [Aspergillus karnatakaensis]|uniref:uncharacterized protein n=1 Tax=Aspergillus karnatakaensis TaxID=1810916 RepID=UPI003CCDF2CA